MKVLLFHVSIAFGVILGLCGNLLANVQTSYFGKHAEIWEFKNNQLQFHFDALKIKFDAQKNNLDFEEIKGKLWNDPAHFYPTEAARGTFSLKERTLNLWGDVSIANKMGDHIKSQHMIFDAKENTFYFPSPTVLASLGTKTGIRIETGRGRIFVRTKKYELRNNVNVQIKGKGSLRIESENATILENEGRALFQRQAKIKSDQFNGQSDQIHIPSPTD